ncbi:imidazole glycerol phosphate synthase subunit HisH [Moorellaceae bacterium AZ2]
MQPISIIDYRMGNLLSVQKALEAVGCPVRVTDRPDEVLAAPGVILPGVGAFGDAMEALKQKGLQEAIVEVCRRGTPFLGICLGMQLLFEASEEGGRVEGLNLLPGVVKRLPSGVKIPHMGWNQVDFCRPSLLFKSIPSGAFFYFVHSYHVEPDDPGITVGRTEYGGQLVAAVQAGNIFGVQFHPEKSSALGLKVLANFGELVYQ